jgi:MoaA/NifB/PqqE/SkfB family radical SAM enzyme
MDVINVSKIIKPKKEFVVDNQIRGRSYSSNHTKLLKHMDRLIDLQEGKRPKPVMFHMSPCNPCNLTCSFCCFANRAMKEMLTVEQMKSAIDQFHALGVTGMEFTGGGEPTLHPNLDEIIEYAYNKGLKMGICTNGSKLKKIKNWHMMSWVRLGMYSWDEKKPYPYHLEVFDGLDIEISAAYVWDGATNTSTNPNITGEWSDSHAKKLASNEYREDNFMKMLAWVEEKKIPCRIAFNAIKDPKIVAQDIESIKVLIDIHEEKHGKLQYAFLSDFNFKGERRNNHCYMHGVKPCVFTDGNVYVCPSAELAPENNYQVNEEFKLCDIAGITDFYNSQVGGPDVFRRHHDCSFCKYAIQNELIDDVLMPTKHNEFA